ncbi:MAG: VCBS repeat-containing protein [Alphaproteobacteria bacterium]|nr:VCBS repeat-containing protein [Alphaproteobacteria bacterium]
MAPPTKVVPAWPERKRGALRFDDMLPALIPIQLPGEVVDLRAADVDGDGDEELVVVTAAGAGSRLTVVDLDAAGDAALRSHVLPAEATWWDAGRGLWGVDARGLRRLDVDQRVFTADTGLPQAPATPTRAGLVVDLDHDGRAELLVRGAEQLWVVREDGTLWGSVPALPAVRLEASARWGGQVAATTIAPPALAIADVDGDGVDDLLFIDGREVRAHVVVPGAISPTPQRWPLPEALREDLPDSELTWARWGDLDGDGKADLLVHRLRTGTLAETEAELVWLRGTGRGLGAPQVIPTGAGSAEAYPVDLDADGDLDVLIPQVPLDVGNLAQAVFDRSVDVSLTLLPMEGGRLGAARSLGTMSLPVEDSAAAWGMFEDLDGDGLPDLAVAVNGQLRVRPGTGDGVARQASVELPLGLAATNLWALDLTGDGAAELVGWAPGEARVVVVRLR